MFICRILVELLKERHESRTLVERENRKQRYLNMVSRSAVGVVCSV